MTHSIDQTDAYLIAWATVRHAFNRLQSAKRGHAFNGGTVVMFADVKEAEADHAAAVGEYRNVCVREGLV